MILLVLMITLLLLYFLQGMAKPLGLLAYPGDHRHHEHPTPMVGGIAMYLGLVFAILFIDRELIGLLPSVSLLCLVGAVDDRYKISSSLRFIIQGVAVTLMVQFTGVQLLSLGAVFGQNELLLGKWSLALTIFASIGVINAINMSDGMDGQAGSLCLLLFILLYVLGAQPEVLLSALILVSIGFLAFNLRLLRPRAKIFMGDAGSTMLGLLIAYLLIKNSQGTDAIFQPVMALWFLALPLIDAVAVLLVRPLRGQSPFAADRIHYHHIFQTMGLSVNRALLLILLIQSALIGVGLLANQSGISDKGQLYCFLTLFLAYCCALFAYTHKEVKKTL